jgi:hypothetical protein
MDVSMAVSIAGLFVAVAAAWWGKKALAGAEQGWARRRFVAERTHLINNRSAMGQLASALHRSCGTWTRDARGWQRVSLGLTPSTERDVVC